MEKRTFDAKVWATGTGLVISVPKLTARVLKIQKGDIIKVTIEKSV